MILQNQTAQHPTQNFTPTLTTRLIGTFRTASFYGLFSCSIHRSELKFLNHLISSLNTRLQRHFLAATLHPQSRGYGRFGFYIIPNVHFGILHSIIYKSIINYTDSLKDCSKSSQNKKPTSYNPYLFVSLSF